ncbi:MAG TPA: hypothetical protein VM580_21710, partial [Labilithrix sp.]|nr:hypothetical protein [Labilithrix sp.]
MRHIAVPRRDHDIARLPSSSARTHTEAAVQRFHGAHHGEGLDRCIDLRRVALEERGDFAHREIPVRLCARVAVTWKSGLPRGRQRAQRVPARAPPAFCDAPSLEDDVVDPAVGQAAAHC